MKVLKWQLLIFFIYSLNANTQILNGEFNEWQTTNEFDLSIENPTSWSTNNEILLNIATTTTPVTLEVIEGEMVARVESNRLEIDSYQSGILYQTISSSNLKSISYEILCDSIYAKGACVTNILIPETLEVLYTDSIKTESDVFNSHQIEILDDWRNQYDSLTIEFKAFGNIFSLEPENDAYSIFYLDKVIEEYILSTNESIDKLLTIYPNPTAKYISINAIDEHDEIRIINFNGQLVESYKAQNTLDVSTLDTGIYLFQIIRNKTMLKSFKLLKM